MNPRDSHSDSSENNSPIYNRGYQLVNRLEYIAHHLPMIRALQSLRLAEPDRVKRSEQPITPEQIFECYQVEESLWRSRQERIEADPNQQDTIRPYLEWAVYGNVVALRNFVEALSVYTQALKERSRNDLAAIYTIWACNLFWEEGHDKKNLTATIIRERAIRLWEETERLTGQRPFADKLSGVNWSRLFDDLGIPLRLPLSRWKKYDEPTK